MPPQAYLATQDIQKTSLDVGVDPLWIPAIRGGKAGYKSIKKGLNIGDDVANSFTKGLREFGEEIAKTSKKADAKFLGFQKRADGSEYPLFNITKKGHELKDSTVGLETLKKEGLDVPNFSKPTSVSKKVEVIKAEVINELKNSFQKTLRFFFLLKLLSIRICF